MPAFLLSTAVVETDDVLCCPTSPHFVATKPTTSLPLLPLGLRALTPVPMHPQWHHHTSASSLSRLLRIARIEVTRAPGAVHKRAKDQEYVVNLYYEHTESHIPTAMWSQHPTKARAAESTAGREPDLRVRHTIAQFCSLRNVVHSCVETNDHRAQCDQCQQLSTFVTRGDGRPMAFVGLALNAATDASPLLTGFVGFLLDACHAQPTLPQASTSGCRPQRRVALALHDFLFRSS